MDTTCHNNMKEFNFTLDEIETFRKEWEQEEENRIDRELRNMAYLICPEYFDDDDYLL